MSAALIFAIPSKGRLQEQAADWLADIGFGLSRAGGERGYAARLSGLDDVEVRLLSAREIASGLDAGDIHLGVTGEDLLNEVPENLDARIALLRGLGWGRADLVVAVPQSWIDVSTMHDLDEVAHIERERRDRQLRVATKYVRLTRRAFAASGLSDYRIVESHGATEGAPASGLADVIVDITTTGATLSANHLKVLADGVILRSQAQLAASLNAPWGKPARAALKRFLDACEARAAGAALMHLRVGKGGKPLAEAAKRFNGTVDPDEAGVLVPRDLAIEAAAYLRDAAGTAVLAAPASYLFTPSNPVFDAFLQRLN